MKIIKKAGSVTSNFPNKYMLPWLEESGTPA